ncbi:MAG TPA: hypothetical protein PLL10_09890, partial [Elusimicrobiales bacterium]|nr:hypothetical protein [Elusimicrobiales bacterium]
WFRYPLMLASAWTLLAAWAFWKKAALNPTLNIYGVDILSTQVAGQDIARLVRSTTWTPELAAARYLTLGKAAVVFSAISYIAGTIKNLKQAGG